MDVHADAKAHATSVVLADKHGGPAPAIQTHARPLRSGSSKRNPKPRKQQDNRDGLKQKAGVSVLDQRLNKAIKTKRLDLSLPRVQMSSATATTLQSFQILPPVILEHELLHLNLAELWLTNHHLSTLPPEIAVLKKLRVLGLAGNVLTALPEGLSQLTALEALYLEKNCLQVIPAKVAFPAQLRDLRLDSNQLAIFPMQVTKLRLLNRLGLSHNLLKALPEQVQRLRNLVELDLDYNRLSAALPDGFASLQRLERLGLEGNYLDEKPRVLDSLPVLSYVRLSGNRDRFRVERTGTIEGGERKATSALECGDQNLLNAAVYDTHIATSVKARQAKGAAP